MKYKDGMDDGVRAVYEYLQNPTALNRQITFDVNLSLFRLCFGAFTETNDLSLVMFAEWGNQCIVFPGDLEIKGWKEGLQNPLFCAALSRVTLFMASHHGRENGCCDDIFKHCHPDAFVISDKEIVHETQKTGDWYRQHAKGLTNGYGHRRYVFTTRDDKCLSVDFTMPNGYVLTRDSDVQLEPLKPLQSLIPGLSPNPLLSLLTRKAGA